VKKELSTTTIAAVVGIVVVILVLVGWWMWRQPASVGSTASPPGTPQAAAELKSRGQQMREDFMAGHKRDHQSNGGATAPSGQ